MLQMRQYSSINFHVGLEL
ncbi:hypothetical protein Gorai_020634, partial [Gossypium raimondii]|nr:hypothetical protein [Gossypium raimondii]